MKGKLAISVLLILLLAGSALALDTPTHIDIQKLSTSSDGSTVSVGIWWDSVPNATGYNLYQSTDNTTFYLMYKNISSTSITVLLDNGTTYYFKLTAINATEESAPTPVFWINTTTGEASVPHYVPPPGNGTKTYSALLPSISTFQLSEGTYNGSAAVHFHIVLSKPLGTGELIKIYKSTDLKNFTWAAVSGNGSQDETVWDYYDTDINLNGTYFYYARVENITAYGNSTAVYYIDLKNNTVGKVAQLLTPTLQSVKAITYNGKAAVLVDWSAVKYAVSYEVYRATSLSGPWQKLDEAYYQNSTTGYMELIDTYNIQSGKIYYYYIVAVAADGEQSYKSNILWVNIDTGETGVIPVAAVGWIPTASFNTPYWLIAGILVGIAIPVFLRRKRRWRK